MKKWLALSMFVVFFAAASPAQAIYLGTCDGYIKNTTGSLISGAQVNVSVSGCTSGTGCNASTTSDSGGYYVVANLDLAAGGTVSVSASHAPTSGSGSNTGTADQFQAARVNVTLCSAPSSPTLTPQADIHYPPQATLSWTSGTDPYGLPTYDRYQLDSNAVVENATSPQSETSLSYASHTWRVQTCNAGCCSSWSSDTFLVYNNAPSAPTLTDQADTNATQVILSWTSGTDPDADTIYDQYRFNEGNITNATSPQIETLPNVTDTYIWEVRTCDTLGSCSSWVNDTFIKYTCPECPVCPTCAPTEEECPVCITGRPVLYRIPPDVTAIVLECNESWICEDWTACDECGFQTRECADENQCGTDFFKPDLIQECPAVIVPRPPCEMPWWADPMMMAIIVAGAAAAGAAVAGTASYASRAARKRPARRKKRK
jgi:hypothetical protein